MAKIEAFVSTRGNRRATLVPRGVIERKDGRQLRRLTVYLAQDLARRLAVHCAAAGIGLSEFIADVVDDALQADRLEDGP